MLHIGILTKKRCHHSLRIDNFMRCWFYGVCGGFHVFRFWYCLYRLKTHIIPKTETIDRIQNKNIVISVNVCNRSGLSWSVDCEICTFIGKWMENHRYECNESLHSLNLFAFFSIVSVDSNFKAKPVHTEISIITMPTRCWFYLSCSNAPTLKPLWNECTFLDIDRVLHSYCIS